MLQLQKKEKVFRRATRVGIQIRVAAAYAMGMESGGVRQTIPGAHS